jgi:hypothetical protein
VKARKTYDIGDVIEMRTTITDPDTERPVEPGKVLCTVNSPSGTISEPEVTNEGHGLYSAKVKVEEAGLWRYAFDATGKYEGVEEREFKVRPRKVKRKGEEEGP